MFLAAILLSCSTPDTAARWIHVTPWDPLSEELLACDLGDALPVRWVTREAGAVPDAFGIDAPGVPAFADSRVGRVVTDDGRTWVVGDCDRLRAVASPSPPPTQGAATLELLAMKFNETPPEAIEAVSRRTEELDDPELLGELAWELAHAPETASIAVRLARHGLELEGGADPLVWSSLSSVLATALWTEGTREAREEAIAHRHQAALATQTGSAWHTLHRYQEALGHPRSPTPSPEYRRFVTAEGMAGEVTELTVTLRGKLGRWGPALESALDDAAREIAAGPGERTAVCARAQEALERAYDGHFVSRCEGQLSWVPATPTLRARVETGLEASPLPDPLSIEPARPYQVARLGADGGTEAATVVFGAHTPDPLAAAHEGSLRWSLEVRNGDDRPTTAVLTVPSMLGHELFADAQDRVAFRQSATRAAEHAVVVLDLRGNQGGGYGPAYEWLEAFSDTRHATPGSMRNRLAGWRVRDQSSLGGRGPPLEAQVYILIDGATASAAEAFAVLARQLPGARLVGTPSQGTLLASGSSFSTYLPQLQLRVVFGDTAFAWDHLHPVTDGVGMFPDLWYLDDGDVVEAVRRHAAGG